MLFLLLLLLTAAAGGAGYLFYLQQEGELKSTRQDLARLTKEVNDAVFEARRQQSQFNTSMERISAVESSVAAIPNLDIGYARVRLTLSEAEHLLQAAEWQLQLYQDSQSALFALEKAYTRLDSFRDDRALERTTLSLRRLISVLKTLQMPDVEGVLRDTQRLQNRILLLPPVRNWQDEDLSRIYSVAPLAVQGTGGASEPGDDEGESDGAERSWYQKVWDQIVDIRPMTLLGHLSIDSHNQTVLWENLLLLVSRIQSAALHANQAIYNTALDDIIRLVNAAYPEDIRQKAAVIQLITEMQGQVVAVNLPDLANVRKELASAIDNYERTHTGKSATVAPSEADAAR